VTLRARMGLAAGVAVALAVVAVAVSAYAGTRSVLRSQVDSALRTLAAQQLGPSFRPGGGEGPPGNGGGFPGASSASTTSTDANGDSAGDNAKDQAAATGSGLLRNIVGEGPCEHDEGTGIDLRRGPGFGGAAGIVELIYPARCGGGSYTPRAQSSKLTVSSAMKTLANSGQGQFATDLTASDTHLRALVTGIGRGGALVVALPLSDVDHALSSQLLLLAVIAAAGIALAALLGLLVARTALAPIARFTRQTESIAVDAERTERERLDVIGDDELARLARTFNTTLDALEHSVEAQRNLVADASHELRTPIASLRANLQLLRDEALLSPEDRAALRADMIEELDELTALVGDVVELARGAKHAGPPGEVRLDSIVRDTIERTRRRAPGLTLISALEPALVHGEGDRIARAVSNLFDNAVKWSPAGGTIEVGLRDGTLSIRDRGPGFHDEDLPFVFDRFHRAREARSKPGSGLGLAIVKQAAEAHGGFVEAGNAPGGGALIRISFGPTLELELEESEPLSAS
jgi:two-component system sensor histidine kinase MprB